MDDVRVSSLELFFDLVFVFAVTQLTSVLAAEPTWGGVARVVVVFGNLWWMYGGYAWLTNAVPPIEVGLRLLVLAGMGAFLVSSLAIPDAFGEGRLAFGIGYVVVNVIHTAMFMRSTQSSAVAAMRRTGSANLLTALLVLAGAIAGGAALWVLWSLAVAAHWTTPLLTRIGGIDLRPAHFVERHGLMLLIAIGESVVAVGIGIEGHVGGARITTALLGLGIAAALWWLYFDGEDARAEAALDEAPPAHRAYLALYGFGIAFMALLLGIVLFAAGVKLGIVASTHRLTAAPAWFLAAGPATYVAALAGFRHVLRLGPVTARVAIAALCLPTAVLGLLVSTEAQLVALLGVLVAGVVVDRRISAAASGPASRPA